MRSAVGVSNSRARIAILPALITICRKRASQPASVMIEKSAIALATRRKSGVRDQTLDAIKLP
jgi:hypothetical protein